jgi:hypothetical protein
MDKDICIIVQGNINPEWIPLVKKGFKDYPTIYSTWEGTDRNLFDELDVVIYNPMPEAGVKNLNLQRVSSLNGFLKAKEMGFKRVLKWRTDFYCPNTKEFLETFDRDCINFYSWHNDGYITDFFMEGDIDEMIELFSFDNWNSVPYPERAFTDRLFQLGLDKKTAFNCKKIFEPNDVKWIKHGYWLSFNTLDDNYKDKIII